MRQPFLGKLDWIEADINRTKVVHEEKAA
jgi:hypothetical protein